MGFVSNYIANLARLAVRQEPRRPLLFSYYVTHRCSLSCRYCSDGSGTPFKQDAVAELSTQAAKDLITRLRRSCDTLDITGGEPLLREDLEQLLAHAKAQGFRTVLNTKGIGLPQRPEIALLCDVLVLSVDSLDRATLADIIGAPEHVADSILQSLQWLLEDGQKLVPRAVVSVVAMPRNLAGIRDILRLCVRHSLGFQISPQIVGTSIHPDLRNNEAFGQLMREILQAKSRGANVLGVEPYLRGIADAHPYTCHPLLMPTIRPDGKVNLPCLERPAEQVDLTTLDCYDHALTRPRVALANSRRCRGQCQIFCHMALSLLQRHPLAALRELEAWRTTSC